MRSVITAAAIVAFASASACHRVQQQPSSNVSTADPAATRQLISGFYPVEGNAWRWAVHTFTVALKPPAGTERTGAKLVLQFFIPDSQIEKLGPVTISATVDGEDLEPQTFSTGGAHFYSRDVGAEFLDTNIVPFQFTFDKYVAASAADPRELAAVINRIALLPR